jgi:ABC-2 type transport system permease protein
MNGCRAGLICGARQALRAPGNLLVRTGFFMVILLVMAQLWRAASASGRPLAGYDLNALLWYVFAAQAAVLAVKPRTILELGDEIGDGRLAIAMLRPVSVLWLRVSIELGESMVQLTLAAVSGMALTLLLAGPPHSALALMLAVVALPVAAAANLLLQHALGAIAFWLRDARSTWFVFQKLVFLPGGMLIPLELLPPPLAAAVHPLPFAAMAYVPGRLASGHAEPGLLLFQIAWVLVLALLATLVFAAGQRRLQVVGG